MRGAIRQYFNEITEDVGSIINVYKEKHASLSKTSSSGEKTNLLEFLPYRKYLPESGMFENKNSIGFIIRASHFSGINEQAKQVIRNAILDIPSSCTVQIMNYASPRIGKLLDYWHENSKRDAIFKKVSEKRRDYFRSGAWGSILGNRKNIIVRNFELYISFSIVKSEYGKLENLHVLLALKEKVIHSLKGINCDVIALNDKELINLVKEFINPSPSLYQATTTENRKDIRENFISPHQVEMHKERTSISIGGDNFNYLTFEIVECPSIWRFENAIDYVGQFDNGNSLPCPFYITLGFKLEGREKSERVSDKYRMLKTKQGDSKLPMFFPKMIEEI